MPNLVNEVLLADLRREFKNMGSCLVITFDKLQPEQDKELRGKFRDAGVKYRVVKNRLAVKAFAELKIDLAPAFVGRCGVAIAKKEGAIAAARLVRDYSKKQKLSPVKLVGGVVEGQPFVGTAAEGIANLPDRHTVNTMLATAVSGPARSLATVVSALAAGMARCIQARVDQAGPEAAPAPAPEAGAAG
ncbi:MAG TPA: 50S ribosomal protein L10 [Planctomycetota bacterium]|nr:50S ribosomal protein L10 [Planctomycetota bacterium]